MFCEKEAFSSRSHFFHLECVRDGFPKNNCNLRLSREGRAYNRKSTSNQSTEFKPVECMMATMIKIMIKSFILDGNASSCDDNDGDYLNDDDDDANDDDDDDQRWCIIVTERRETRHLALLHCAAAAPSHG